MLLGEKVLSDNTTVANNNLQDGASLRLVLSLQGGPIGTSRRMLPLDNETIKQLVNLNKLVVPLIIFYLNYNMMIIIVIEVYLNKK